jgi:hypothetical protein
MLGKVPAPDFSIHLKRSFSADFTDGKNFYHVKSQTLSSQKLYGDSWLLQRTDPLVKGKENLDNHYLILTTVDPKEFTMQITGIVRVSDLHNEGLFGECKIEWLRKNKVALYLNDLKRVIIKKIK